MMMMKKMMNDHGNGDDEHKHRYDGREAQCDAVQQGHSLQKCGSSCKTAEMKPA